MKICVTVASNTLESPVDPRFGRCQYLLFVDLENMSLKAVSNVGAGFMSGAGVQVAQNIVKEGAAAVITGNVGPNAFQVLRAGGVKVFTGIQGTAREAIERYKKGELKETVNPSAPGHFGMGRGGMGGGRGR